MSKLVSHCDRCRNIQPASGSATPAISMSGQRWGQIMLTSAPPKNISRRAMMMWRTGLNKVPIWSQWGMFSMGVANPERMTAGIMNTKEPSKGLLHGHGHRDDTSNPTPTMVMMKHRQGQDKEGADGSAKRHAKPINRTCRKYSSASMQGQITIPGRDFPMRISPWD